ncbi:hypothetical protein [Spirulina sp. 06S082]|uniref:hypothetical protein n=1 Tax=Spirulina sp. 06S082 TaxID=3110248 RepID=UPI002B2055FD|nr:hypothetical protein [Spirulina sp. 06S082]MEA5469498.1 hypothetical protein [Spirulina sp. 06S082]
MRSQIMGSMGFWIGWVVATFLGFLLSLLFVEVGEIPDVTAVYGAIGGGIIGLMQGLVLLRRVDRLREWILVNAIAVGIMAWVGLGAIGWVAPRTDFLVIRLTYGIVLGAIAGIVSGTMQSFVLRHTIPFPYLWAVLNSVCWGFSLGVGWTIGGILRSLTHLYLSEAIGLGLTWICSSTIMGFALTSLLQWQKRLE